MARAPSGRCCDGTVEALERHRAAHANEAAGDILPVGQNSVATEGGLVVENTGDGDEFGDLAIVDEGGKDLGEVIGAAVREGAGDVGAVR